MASFEQTPNDTRVHLSAEDLTTIEARKLDIDFLATGLTIRAAEYCSSQQTMLGEGNGSCELKASVNCEADKSRVDIKCDKTVCSTGTLFASYAAQTIMKRVNTETQFRRQFKR